MAGDLALPSEHGQHVVGSLLAGTRFRCSPPLSSLTVSAWRWAPPCLAVGFPGTDPRVETHLDTGLSGGPSCPQALTVCGGIRG